MKHFRLELARNLVPRCEPLVRVERCTSPAHDVRDLRHEPSVDAEEVVRVVRAALEQIENVGGCHGCDVCEEPELDVPLRRLEHHRLVHHQLRPRDAEEGPEEGEDEGERTHRRAVVRQHEVTSLDSNEEYFTQFP